MGVIGEGKRELRRRQTAYECRNRFGFVGARQWLRPRGRMATALLARVTVLATVIISMAVVPIRGAVATMDASGQRDCLARVQPGVAARRDSSFSSFESELSAAGVQHSDIQHSDIQHGDMQNSGMQDADIQNNRELYNRELYNHELYVGELDSPVCAGGFRWPVANQQVVSPFDAPPQPWAPGHRGIDLQSVPGTKLMAPANGVIHFVGTVAGKSVVSIRHGTLISTFEPAQTELTKGATIKAGEVFAKVAGGSDHCGTQCVHWGLKSGAQEYIDPEQMVGKLDIVLKVL